MKEAYKLAYAIARLQATVNWINEHWDYTFDENDLEQLNQAQWRLNNLKEVARKTRVYYLVPIATSHLNHKSRVQRHQLGLMQSSKWWYRILLYRRAKGEHTGYWWRLSI